MGSTNDNNMVFGLDIGTRSVVGTVGIKLNANDFMVEAISVREHSTRAMLDGQIHDIYMVTQTISDVKQELERKTGLKLDKVCIAAAGRVLKTETVVADVEFPYEQTVTDEDVYSLELAGVEAAYNKLAKQINSEDIRFYCVGYTCVKYFLNGYSITKLQGHRANKISVELLATFLPEEVIEGLYTAVEGAGLTVENLTLEPIAAINVAIPEKFRLLNIALVDIGAGTSDICITKDGSVVAYGMIPYAGDEITEAIAHKYLVEFNEAERIKVESTRKKQVSFTDIMGIKNKIPASQVHDDIAGECNNMAKCIADKIIELNGGKSVSAVFVVGGGGKYPGFVEFLADCLGLSTQRVALRGEEVLQNVIIRQENVKKDPLLVTPIGICLNYYENKNSFVSVTANGTKLKIFDNNNLTIADAALQMGIKNEELFPRNGKNLSFTLNGQNKTVRGSFGEPAVVTLNGQNSSITAAIKNGDVITIKKSIVGDDAKINIGRLKEYKENFKIYIDDNQVIVPSIITVNGNYETKDYNILPDDDIVIKTELPFEMIKELTGINPDVIYNLNGINVANDDIIKDGDMIYQVLDKKVDVQLENDISDEAQDLSDTKFEIKHEIQSEIKHEPQVKKGSVNTNKEIFITVNKKVVKLTGKTSYIFVDILDFYPFDTSTIGGTKLILKVNNMPADFTTRLNDGDNTQIYWEG